METVSITQEISEKLSRLLRSTVEIIMLGTILKVGDKFTIKNIIQVYDPLLIPLFKIETGERFRIEQRVSPNSVQGNKTRSTLFSLIPIWHDTYGPGYVKMVDLTGNINRLPQPQLPPIL